MLPLALFSWTVPDMKGVLLGAAMGFFAAASHFMIIKAFEFASASELSPFNYFEIVGAITLSYIVFGYIPNLQAIIGLFVIIGSGLFVSWRVMKNNDGQAEDGIRDQPRSRGLGDVYKRQVHEKRAKGIIIKIPTTAE